MLGRSGPGYRDGSMTAIGMLLSRAGFVALTAGGWYGGTVVFVHGIRVSKEEQQ
jgi:uncharacterized membrane protein